jgi:peptidoglycan/LPS O-acetylase OafA/YrhL
MAMRKVNQRRWLSSSALAVVVLSIAALVVILSVVVTSGAGHGFEQIALALPIFFVLLFLASIEDWLQLEDSLLQPEPRLSLSHTRAPPA